MGDNSKKRGRKSKLVPRESLDSDDENIAVMQYEIEQTIARMTSSSILKKLSRTEESLKFSVKVEIEEVDENFDTEPKNDLNISIGAVVSLKDTTENDINHASLKVAEKSNSVTSQYIFKAETIINELDKIKEKSFVDRQIGIHIRNYFGRYFLKADLDTKDVKLQGVFEKWKTWCRINPDDRGAPILYKCYICGTAWWHYHDFREHLESHDDFKLELEIYGQECIMIAFEKEVSQNFFQILDNCWRCGKEFLFHQNRRNFKKIYYCSGCLGKFSTCLKLSVHEGSCGFYKKSLQFLGKNVDETHPCDLCPFQCYSQKEFDVHIRNRHSVRSDLPILTNYKACRRCLLMCDELTHECITQPYDINKCKFCDRKFNNISNYQMHTKTINYTCIICNEILPNRCMELKHLLKHTNNYTVLYKCLLCPQQVYFSEQQMVESHYTTSHQQLNKASAHFFDEVVVPASLIEKHSSTEAVQPKVRRKELDPTTKSDGHTEINVSNDIDKSSDPDVKPIIKLEFDYINGIKREVIDFDNVDADDTIVKQEIVEHVIEVCQLNDIKTEIQDKTDDIDDGSLIYNCTKLYNCKKCNFQGLHREYQEHLRSKCLNRSVYNCTKCHRSFLTMKRYLLHFRAHGYDDNTCPKCFKIINMNHLINHVYQHVKNNFIGCRFINNSSSNKCYQCKECHDKVLFKHFFKHWETHIEMNATYNTVDDSVVEKPLLQELIALLIGESSGASKFLPKQCIMCLKLFARRNDLKRHMIEHLLNDAYRNRSKYECLKCQICNLGFNKADVYKHHMRVHGSLPLYKCEICDKTFSDSSNFSKHKKVHNLSVVICDICRKKFTCKAILIKHLEMHEKLKPIKCGCCDRIFHTQSLYRKHRKVKTRYRCNVCDMVFNKLKDKWDHMWIEHKERKYLADCPICNKSYRKFRDVKFHIKTEHDPNYVYRPVFLKVNNSEIIVCD